MLLTDIEIQLYLIRKFCDDHLTLAGTVFSDICFTKYTKYMFYLRQFEAAFSGRTPPQHTLATPSQFLLLIHSWKLSKWDAQHHHHHHYPARQPHGQSCWKQTEKNLLSSVFVAWKLGWENQKLFFFSVTHFPLPSGERGDVPGLMLKFLLQPEGKYSGDANEPLPTVRRHQRATILSCQPIAAPQFLTIVCCSKTSFPGKIGSVIWLIPR